MMRRLLARLDAGDWFVVAAALLVVLGLELTKPVTLFDRATGWFRAVAEGGAPEPREPAETRRTSDGSTVRRLVAGDNPNTICPAPAGKAVPLIQLPSGVREVVHVTEGPLTDIVRDKRGKALADGAMGALAAAENGAYGRTFRYASRTEAVRSALALCRLHGGEDCRIVLEILPRHPDSYDTCAWTLTSYQWDIKTAFEASRAKAAVLAVNRSGNAAFAEHENLDAAARAALGRCVADAEIAPDGVDSPCFVLRASSNGWAVPVEKPKFRRMGETNWSRYDTSTDGDPAPAPAPETHRKLLFTADDANKLCPPVKGAGFTPVRVPPGGLDVVYPAASEAGAMIDRHSSAMQSAGAFSALAADKYGHSGLVLAYAARSEAQRAALAICRETGGTQCRLVREVIPKAAQSYLTCDWRFPPALSTGYDDFLEQDDAGKTVVFAASRNGAFGVGAAVLGTDAADLALDRCIAAAALRADPIDSPCFVLAARSNGGRIGIDGFFRLERPEAAAP